MIENPIKYEKKQKPESVKEWKYFVFSSILYFMIKALNVPNAGTATRRNKFIFMGQVHLLMTHKCSELF